MKRTSLSYHSIGFTLVELLVGIVIASVAITAAARVHVGHIRSSGASVTSGQLQRDLGRLQRLLQTEIQEACLLQAGTTSPTSCTQASCTATGGNEIRFLVSIATSVNADPNAAANLRVISYRLNGTQLLRNGPRILASGSLDSVSGNDQTNAVVLDGVNTFIPTVAADCRSVDIAVRLDVPNSTVKYPIASLAPENMTFSAGSGAYL